MSESIKKKTATGFMYRFAERVGAQGITFLIQLLLARILIPEDYGVVALVSIFITICDVFVTYGFGNALVVNKNSDSLDFSTCFYFSFALSIIIYALVFVFAPVIAEFYHNIALTPIIRVMGLRIPIAAFNSVQHAYVSKHMLFKKFFYATLIGTILSGVIAVIMAYAGFGAWAMVEQYLGNIVIDTVCLWIIVGWRPTWEFSFERLRFIYSYGWKVLVVGLIDTVYSRLRGLAIGRGYSSTDLAYYNRGYAFPSFGMRLVQPTINSVLFAALAQNNNKMDKMRGLVRQTLQITTYIISPIMVGLIVTARPAVLFLLGKKWLPCVPFLQIGCVANLFRCQQFINNSVVKASGDSGLLLKLDIVKKSIGLVILIVSMKYGVIWIAWSQAIFYFISMMINIAPNRKILNYGYRTQFLDMIKNMIPAFVMGLLVWPISMLPIHNTLILFLQVVAGVCVYLGLSAAFKNESLYMTIRYGRKLLKGKRLIHNRETDMGGSQE